MIDPSAQPGAIGAEIDGPSSTQVQQDSKAKKFFTDPKNLATMLVMAAAVSQPRQGRSVLGHTLRSGVGALGFRGGLEQGIATNEQTAAEAGSVIEGREAQAQNNADRNAVLGDQVAATTRGQDIDVTEGALDRTSAEKIAQTRAAAIAQDSLANKMLMEGLKGYHTAMNLHLANPQLIARPNIKDYMPVMPEGFTLDEILPQATIVDPELPTPDASTAVVPVDKGPQAPTTIIDSTADLFRNPTLPSAQLTRETRVVRVMEKNPDMTDEQAQSFLSTMRAKAHDPTILATLSADELRNMVRYSRFIDGKDNKNVQKALLATQGAPQ